jgi:hypothetical protein
LNEDLVPPPVSERHDVAAVLALESAKVPAVTSHFPVVEVPLRRWKFEVLPRPRRWRSPPQPEFPSRSRR